MAESENLVSDINDLIAWEESTAGWGPTFLSMLGNLGDWVQWVPMAFAPAAHSHDGLGGEVMGIGTSDARPAVVEGYILSATDTEQIEMIDASGNLIAAAAMQGQPLPMDEQASDPSTAANQIKIYPKSTGLFFRHPSDGPVVEIGSAPTGHINGLIPAYVSGSAMGFGAGDLDIEGRTFYLASAFSNLDCSGLSANTWYYVEILPPASGNAITVDDFVVTVNAPSWDGVNGCWARVSGRRCVFAFKTSSSGGIEVFRTNGRTFWFNQNSATILNTSSPATSATTLAVGLPALGALKWYGTAWVYQSNSATYWIFMTSTNVSGGGAVGIAKQNAPGEYLTPFTMMSDDAGNVAYQTSWGGSGNLGFYLRGFDLPAGMAR
ncbi:MAG: hypothetical protein K9K65_11765 [Desulfarculaceae bacterium]|nr:hypothetical protein [Desulfarculaceae bacterium]MCF8122315.1 hypothetical protein [Desulfarculaceae bacterium]